MECRIDLISKQYFPIDNATLNEVMLVFQYHSEVESGGHEMLLHWGADYIEKIGLINYLKDLVVVLKKIGADDYTVIGLEYGPEMWNLYRDLEQEQEQIHETAFYAYQKGR